MNKINKEKIFELLNDKSVQNSGTQKSNTLLSYKEAILTAKKNGKSWKDIQKILQQNGLQVSISLLVNLFSQKKEHNYLTKENMYYMEIGGCFERSFQQIVQNNYKGNDAIKLIFDNLEQIESYKILKNKTFNNLSK